MNTVLPQRTDHHSFSNTDALHMQHAEMHLAINFDRSVIQGKITYTIRHLKSCSYCILDTMGLIIQKVSVNDKPVLFRLGNNDPILGTSLIIPIESTSKTITICYETTKQSHALQWLSPNQTKDNSAPFLYTQSQPILARSWFPCQDSPQVRFTYNASVTVPQGILPLMSAENPKETNTASSYSFHMPQPIPAYLVALAAGNIQFQPIGKRTGIYAEPSLINDAVKEFNKMELMLQTAESLYGHYLWHRYDVLVLPPGFPFGGMENPRITFATPTLIAGDQSLTNVIAHELAHSWSGNLVTNKTWDDFWLNEGFTVYFERRIMEEIEGKDYAEILATIGFDDLKGELIQLRNQPNDTKLHLNLEGRDPDEGTTLIAYEKGYLFLLWLEEQLSRPVLDQILRNYFTAFRFKPIDTEMFLSFLREQTGKETYLLLESGLKEWIYQSGLPLRYPEISSAKLNKAKDMAAQCDSILPDKSITAQWNHYEIIYFLRHLDKPLDEISMKKIDDLFAFSQSQNSEAVFHWLALVIKNNYQLHYPLLNNFLKKIGRRKFIEPLYELVNQHIEEPDFAKNIYNSCKSGYHYLTRAAVEKILSL